jgi:ribosome-binding ATPase YchF (GTP1/OBG family)
MPVRRSSAVPEAAARHAGAARWSGFAATEGSQVVPVCAGIEAEVSQLEESDRAAFLAELKLDEPGL